MNPPVDACDLCGLPLRFQQVTLEAPETAYRFCCTGCKHVFQILVAASDATDPGQFKETELFLKCREMGVIPRSEEDLKPEAQKKRSLPQNLSPEAPHEGKQQVTMTDGLDLIFKINGMWCPACAWIIEASLVKIPGVINASCNFSTDRLRCSYHPGVISPVKITDTIGKLGYHATIPEESQDTAEKKIEFIRFAISAFLTMNIMMLSFALYSGFFTSLSPDTVSKLSWPSFVMATVVVFYGGKKIFQRAIMGVVSVAFSMETLIGAGSLSAYLYSVFHIFSGSIHLYFDTASMLITLTLLGKTLERHAKDRVQSDLGSFFALRPTKVKICTAQYPEGRYVSVKHLQKNDIFCVDEGEMVPADGLITNGTGFVDESSLTGEATPIKKISGDRLKSGTNVTHGGFKVKAEGVGEESTLGQMIQILEKALGAKTPLEGKTDRILHWFVPAIFVTAIGTGIVWFLLSGSVEISMLRAVTVMVISCPCALGVAIPLARVAGISVTSKQGVLVRNFSSFEQAEKVNAFVFDKTGTITIGQWALQKIILMRHYSENEVLSFAAALERDSEHYIAAEIRRNAKDRNIGATATEYIEHIAHHENGISGKINNQPIKIGSRDYLAEEIRSSDLSKLNPSDLNPSDLNPFGAENSTVFMSIGKRLCAVFIFGDQIRDNACETVAYLRSRGFFTALVSGDGKTTTQHMGEKIRIQQAMGGQLPHDKANLIKNLQQKGHRVVMVGDGINDAPALAQADLAMAVHSGSHLGKEVADITLMRSDPSQVIDFLVLSRQVNRKVQQNLLCALFYNVVSIPIAMIGLLSPLIAVSAMLMSSLSVIGNTLLLVRNTRQKLPHT
jgi:heavy metal translocating P-type ATPase